jgi:hypothetical protein
MAKQQQPTLIEGQRAQVIPGGPPSSDRKTDRILRPRSDDVSSRPIGSATRSSSRP